MSITGTFIDLSSSYASGELGYHGARYLKDAYQKKEHKEEEKCTSNPARWVAPFIVTTALKLKTDIPVHPKTPKIAPPVASAVVYSLCKNVLEDNHLPVSKKEEIQDGAIAGGTASLVDSAIRKIGNPVPLRCYIPRALAKTPVGALTGMGVVLAGQLTDKIIEKPKI